MPAATQRSPRILYVAGSAREFPQEVQDWLGRIENPAAAAPSIYDALARLTKRQRPAAVLVSIESVDWEEMEFFDLASRLSPDTSLYVAGHKHHRAKLEAACQRGARRFDADQLAVDLGRPAPGDRTTAADLLAGTISSFPETAGRQLHVTRLPEDAAPAEPPPAADQQKPPSAGPEPKPPVRLVSPADFDDDTPPAAADDTDAAIPFPWSPSPHRPRRTPPAPIDQQPAAGPDQPEDAQPPAGPEPRPASAELTPEEIAALLGRRIDPPPGTAREQTP